MSKIIGNPVGTTLPKSDWKQTDPNKGDYIKNKPDFEGLENKVNTVSDLVGDTPVATQIAEATKTLTIEEIDAICGVDDVTALVNADYLAEATDSEGNILTDNQNNTYVF